MRVFITGASGHIGSAVVPALISGDHEVIGLARSEASAAAIEAAGGRALRGDLDDLEGLRAAARAADGVIHLAYKHEAMVTGDYLGAAEDDLRVVRALGEALTDSGKPFVGIAGTLALAVPGRRDRPGTEHDTVESGPRIDAENFVIGLAEHGVRSSVVRLSPLVHSSLDHHGFTPMLIEIAATTGVSGYLGDGANRWPAVHTLDAARLIQLALERAPAGSRLHGVADEGVPFREIAEVIGQRVNVPVEPIAPEEAMAHFGFLGRVVGLDDATANAITRELLDWEPVHPGLIEDMKAGHYFAGR
ncbi:SDR family oxidoreductase [Nocardia acidivorans]|uniref:SDR family oxidoreductase n=1 Tax=Nocardia acidivorans TaxID=404580 RepID=UPI000830452A|nr:SDR family oxidoreductase [Nocardia acidivorans]